MGSSLPNADTLRNKLMISLLEEIELPEITTLI